MVNPTEFL
jgi:hypothetical protein